MSFFRRASKHKSKLRMALDGPAGSGKTFTALRFAFALVRPNVGRVAVINSESGAVEKYLGLSPDGIPWDFDVGELTDFAPTTYTSAILEAGRAGYDVVVIDSLSHAWQGAGGALEIVNKKGGNSYTAWKDVTPMHNRMVDAMLRSPCHVIVTMRSKMEYVLEEQISKTGKPVQVPRKIGMAPIQRAGMEYEFDVVADMDWQHTLTVSKTRCPAIDEAVVVKPGAAFIQPVIEWLNEGVDAPPGFYTASEEDLRLLDERRAAEARARAAAEKAAEPKKTVEELMAEAAARQSAFIKQANEGPPPKTKIGEPFRNNSMADWGANNTAASIPPNPDDPGSITTAQVARIRDWFACLSPELTPAIAEAAIQKRGANKLRELTWRNAEGLIEQLVKRGLLLGRCPSNGPAPPGLPVSDTNGNGLVEAEHAASSLDGVPF